MWERAYAVTKTKRCVEGAAGTRGADETITEGLFVPPSMNRNEIKRASTRVLFFIALKSHAHYTILALEKQTYLYVNKYEYKYEYKIQTSFWERNYG